MVVIEALRHVQDRACGVTAAAEGGNHVAEIAQVGLVRTDVLGRVDRVECDAQSPVARGEAAAIDIRENDERVELREILAAGTHWRFLKELKRELKS